MPLTFRWVEDDERDRVAVTRMRAYAPASKDLPRFQERIRTDPRVKAGDFLLAELDGEPVGTSTSLSLTTWVRGGAAWCQGVAYVGTIRSHRRGGSADQPGIATRIMNETLRRARERNQSVSALMPFRNSFYERFGYGVVERRHDWVIPTPLLPAGDTDGLRHYRSTDLEALAVCRQKQVCRGQCDIKRTKESWINLIGQFEDGHFFVDRPESNGPIRGYVYFETVVRPDGRWQLVVEELGYEDAPALLRILRMLGSLKDQYATCHMLLPVDLPLQRLLKESQVPHRIVPHAAAECRMQTRMMMRILDHKAFLESMVALPPDQRGRAVVAVHEVEGDTGKFLVDLADGRMTVTPSDQSPQFECNSATWASIACGETPASQAVRYGLATGSTGAVGMLDALAVGPMPFTSEAF
ncbi:GNAT family N-acetyltransferase [Humisphaera borealis]|uniref:GNAT family N-acetyltransferase n=1 Tax=Humisphaera borealis TaxID=2807512 RepID=A0A7M2X5H7_9BACT|nr:GNAT family N-acetyltransferase [Humisphaera borealis]QOV92060.1 GNAT family N-acetyltransferase [Humisphaera borealis]